MRWLGGRCCSVAYFVACLITVCFLFSAFFYAEWNGIPTGWAWLGSTRKVGTERVSVFSQQDDTPFFIEVMELE